MKNQIEVDNDYLEAMDAPENQASQLIRCTYYEGNTECTCFDCMNC